MAPLIVLLVAWVAFRVAGRLGAKRFSTWRDSCRAALAVMFLFTAATHFSPMKHDFARMIPEPLPNGLWVIYLTGVLEIAGAIGLLIPRFQRIAGICLILLMAAMFPANVNAALNDIMLRGNPATPLIPRTLLQILWMVLVWWSAVRRPREGHVGVAATAA
jgi:uncharacterized membrane protein